VRKETRHFGAIEALARPPTHARVSATAVEVTPRRAKWRWISAQVSCGAGSVNDNYPRPIDDNYSSPRKGALPHLKSYREATVAS
jgi:hypothetical protein